MSLAAGETKDAVKKTTAKAVRPCKLKDPGIQFYMVAVRETIARGDAAEMKTLLASVEEVQKAGGLEPLIANLRNAIDRAR